MRVAYVKWRDAITLEADTTTPAKAELAELSEVGWLLDETEDALLIGMEIQPEGTDVEPGRWRLNIPKSGIIELRVMDLGKAFPKRSVVT